MRLCTSLCLVVILVPASSGSFAEPFFENTGETVFSQSHNFLFDTSEANKPHQANELLAQKFGGQGGTDQSSGFSRPSFKVSGAAHKFLFLAVLEGLYEDGVSRDDTARILHREEGQSYTHFISHCPLCESVLEAIEVYAARPNWGWKAVRPPVTEATFGPGLDDKTKEGLASDDVKVRLTTIFGLVSRWVNVRLARTPISDEERAALQAELELGKKEGLRVLTAYKRDPSGNSIRQLAPGFSDLNECAMCSGATNSTFDGKTPMGIDLEKKPQKGLSFDK